MMRTFLRCASCLPMKNDPLKSYRRRLVASEAALTKSRDLMSAATKRKGVSTEGIFSETKFVPRKTADRWVAEARRDCQKELGDVFVSIIRDMRAVPEVAAPADVEPPRQLSKPTLVVDNQREAARGEGPSAV